MSVNIPAIATGAFLGFLALVVLLTCVPALTRFLGDLCCCPWRIPFTKRRRRNDDEEMDKNDLPYVVHSPRPGTPVDDRGYQRVSAAHMSAVSVVDPEMAKKEMRRSAEYHRREHSPYRNHDHYYQHHDAASFSGSHPQGPGREAQGNYYREDYQGGTAGGLWSGPSSERDYSYPPAQAYHGDGYAYAPEYSHNDGSYGQDYAVDLQRPQHAYSPPEASKHGHGHDGYFPEREEHGRHDFGQQYHSSSEPLVKPVVKQSKRLHKKNVPNI